jgi:pilus assembly protein Flp/PilA
MANLSERVRRSQRGQGLVEYAMILVLVAVVVILVLSLIGPTINNQFYCKVANAIHATLPPSCS